VGLLKYLTAILLLFLIGCAPSSIKLNTKIDDSGYQMFGKDPGRSFYYSIELKDTLIEKWTGEVNGSFNNSSVTFSDTHIFVNDLSGRISSFNIENGKRTGQVKNSGTVVTAPVIHKYFLIYADAYDDEKRSDLIYYDFSLGKIINKVEIKGRILSQLIKTVDGIIFVTENGIAGKYNFLGSMLWETETDNYVHTSPASGSGRVIFGNDRGDIIGLDENTGEKIFEINTGVSIFGSPSISDGSAYLGNDGGTLYSIDINKGEVNWTFQSSGRIIANPVIENNNLIFTNLNGDIYKLNKYKGELVWMTSTQGVLNASPLVTINRILVPDLAGYLHFIDYESGDIVKSINYPARMKLSPVIIGNYLFIGYDKGILKAYEIIN
jgi:outer membrane protein assembly factor BamB